MIGDWWDSVLQDILEFFTPDKLLGYLFGFIKIVAILLLTRLVMRFTRYFVEKVFKESKFKSLNYNQRRLDTLKSLTLSLVRYVLYFFAGIMILQEIGFPVASLIAGAGIFGLAVGFGAQDLVRDVISGFFILFDSQFGVGDHVKIDEFEGIVQEIGLRSTRIKGFSGAIYTIPNGEINKVINYLATDSIRVMFDVAVAYEEDIDRVYHVLEEVCQQSTQENNKWVEAPKVLGIQELGDYSINFRILGRAIPMEQWGVERELKKRIKKAFDREGIEIPYPKRVLYMDAKEKSLEKHE